MDLALPAQVAVAPQAAWLALTDIRLNRSLHTPPVYDPLELLERILDPSVGRQVHQLDQPLAKFGSQDIILTDWNDIPASEQDVALPRDGVPIPPGTRYYSSSKGLVLGVLFNRGTEEAEEVGLSCQHRHRRVFRSRFPQNPLVPPALPDEVTEKQR